ncbi:MAG: GTP-binding protein [Candidatus Lernaella stagnicola]|nr:GTP-binding protein [Candidatus Lernaella stagnicola]
MNEPIYLRNVRTAHEAAAERVQTLARDRGAALVALYGQPGTGRTNLIAATQGRVSESFTVAAIAASPADHTDAETLAEAGLPTVAVEVGQLGHLDAAMVEQALAALADVGPNLVLVEQVGAHAADPPLGVNASVVVVAAAGAQHLPGKFETAFAHCQAVVVNMMDLVALTDFRLTDFEAKLRTVNPRAELIPVSCRTGDGLDAWVRWLESFCLAKR